MKRLGFILSRGFALFACSAFFAISNAAQSDAEGGTVLPSPSKAAVGRETPKRSRIVLNGTWEFAPASGVNAKIPSASERGLIRVPGVWHGSSAAPNVVKRGASAKWGSLLRNSACGWFSRKIDIPDDWSGKAVVLELRRICVDARVFVNGSFVGDVRNQGGEIDISKFVRFGSTNSIDILVCSFRGAYDFDKNANPANIKNPKFKPAVAGAGNRGILGDVFLLSRPSGTHIDGVFVRTSVKFKTVSADVEIADSNSMDAAELKVKIFDRNDDCVKSFSQNIKTGISRKQSVRVCDSWENPQLWDTDNPVLYTMEISLRRGGKTLDTYRQRFGFREFSIEGKDFYLNGKKIRLRPLHCFVEGEVGGTRAAISNTIEAMMKCNFNTIEFWPWNHFGQGVYQCRAEWADIADTKGFLIFYPCYGQGSFPPWKWEGEFRKTFVERAQKQWREIRNNPSVVALIGFPNSCIVDDDQNPMRIGNWRELFGDSTLIERYLPMRQAISWIRQMDDTRPVAAHAGANVGDIHTMNHYLNFIPLQEREEWLSEYAESGNMPYMAIEFGTPFICNFQRNRTGPYAAWLSEPQLTETTAAYLGEDSYTLETPAYRNMIVSQYDGGMKWKKIVDLHEFAFAPAMSKFQALFNRNTWRSWRTWGIAGGMVPWRDAYGWIPRDGSVPVKYSDGALGWQPASVSKRGYFGMDERGAQFNDSAKSLVDGMSPALMWICGAENFTDKTHHFYGGEKLSKQIALVNDLRKTAPYKLEWKVSQDGKIAAKGEFSGEVEVGEKKFLPIETALEKVAKKTRGEIEVSGEFGGAPVRDTFKFSVYARPTFSKSAKISVFDPEGSTSELLKNLGFDFKKWNGDACGGILIVGENALDSEPSGSLAEFVKRGGRLLILGQNAKTLEEKFGLRASKIVSRRMFVVKTQASYPLASGLDSEDLRDWAGSGTRVPAYAEIALNAGRKAPDYGWHWGNRGSVASVVVEKPHYAGWSPILEGEFDLAFTPLMEKEVGSGIAVFCALDLAGRTKRDPVADEIFARLVSYLNGYKASAKRSDAPATYVGGSRGEAMLKTFGMNFEKSDVLPESGFAVVGEDSNLTDAQLKAALEKGVNILVVEGGKPRFGLTVSDGKIDGTAKLSDWRETRGVSISEIHSRADIPAKAFAGGDTAFCGVWAKVSFGRGTAILSSISPDMLDVKNKFYLRFTAWRLSRALVQISANLGANFKFDNVLLGENKNLVKSPYIRLSSSWKFAWGDSLGGKNPAAAGFDDSAWEDTIVQNNSTADGIARYPFKKTYWVRKRVEIPADWRGDAITLNLGRIVGGDEVFVNGVSVAGMAKKPDTWLKDRVYEIPQNVVKFGGVNEIAIRVEPYSSGRFLVSGLDLRLGRKVGNVYSSDYIDRHTDGDCPFRYIRW